MSGVCIRILAAVECLTRREQETYEEFIKRAATNPLARQIKIGDLRDNMNLARIAEPTPRDYERLERYRKALEMLGESG